LLPGSHCAVALELRQLRPLRRDYLAISSIEPERGKSRANQSREMLL
jgi:hypothetical protein